MKFEISNRKERDKFIGSIIAVSVVLVLLSYKFGLLALFVPFFYFLIISFSLFLFYNLSQGFSQAELSEDELLITNKSGKREKILPVKKLSFEIEERSVKLLLDGKKAETLIFKEVDELDFFVEELEELGVPLNEDFLNNH